MRAGAVVQIRLNPEDVVSCIDVLTKAGVQTAGMSLAMAVRLTLSAYLEGSRVNGDIPRPDGFDYSSKVAPFLQVNKAKKLQVTSTVMNTEIARMHVDAPASQFTVNVQPTHAPMQLPDNLVAKRGRLMWKWNELEINKRDNPLNFTEHDQQKFDRISEALNQIDAGQDVDVRGTPQSHAPMQLPDHIIRKKGRVYTRILELQSKLEADPDNFTPADSEYLTRLEDAISQMDAGQDVDVSKLL